MTAGILSRRLLPLAICAAIAVFALVRSATVTAIDYDEFEHVRGSYLVSEGLTPYLDFHEAHPPFHWYMWAPVVAHLPDQYQSIVYLRLMNGAFAALFLLLLLGLILMLDPSPEGAIGAAAATTTLVFAPNVTAALAEFRPDQLSFVLIAGGTMALALVKRPHAQPWCLAGAAFLFSWGVMTNLKMVLLPICLTAAILRWYQKEGLLTPRSLSALVIGILLALAGASLFLAAAGLSFEAVWTNSVGYHHRMLQYFSYRAGLARWFIRDSTQINPAPLVALLVSLFGVVYGGRRDASKSRAISVGFLGYAGLQLALVKIGWKQYTTPLYLSLIFPLAYAWGLLLRVPAQRKLWLGLCLCIGLGSVWLGARQLRDGAKLAAQISLGDDLLALAPKGEPVVANPSLLPFRKDSLYSFITTLTPQGLKLNEVMSQLPPYSAAFTEAALWGQLESAPPSMIIVSRVFQEPRVLQVLERFLASRGDEYHRVPFEGRLVFVRSRLPAPAASP